MVNKKSSTQNVIIVILSILLLISIAFGVTYSFYNGKDNLIAGKITTANLSLALEGEDQFGHTTEFQISAPLGEEYLVPGNNLNNVALNINNKASSESYMVVVYSLDAYRDGVSIADELSDTPAIDFITEKLPADWYPITYKCQNIENRSFKCLVGLQKFPAKQSQSVYQQSTDGGYLIPVLKENSIKLPGKEWKSNLMGCIVTISITAYAIQANGLGAEFEIALAAARANDEDNGNNSQTAQLLAQKVLTICGFDAETT